MVGVYAVFGYVYIPFCIVGTIGNLLIIVAILLSKIRTSNSIILIVSLAINNMLYSALALPPMIMSMVKGHTDLDPGFCKFFGFVVVYFVYTNCCHEAAIAVNRFLAIICIHQITAVGQKRVTFVLLLSSWLIPLIVLILPFFGIGGEYGFSKNLRRCIFSRQTYGYILVYRILFQVLPIVIMIVFYIPIIVRIRAVRRSVFSTAASQNHVKEMTKFNTQVRITKNTFFLSIFYLVCFMPSTIWNFISGDPNHDLVENLGPAFFFLMGIGNCVSAIIYAMLSMEIRKAVKEMFQLCRRTIIQPAALPTSTVKPTSFEASPADNA